MRNSKLFIFFFFLLFVSCRKDIIVIEINSVNGINLKMDSNTGVLYLNAFYMGKYYDELNKDSIPIIYYY
jgi:hypothetical protein